MNNQAIRISLEQAISNELYDVFEGEIIEKVLSEAKIEKVENEWKYLLEGHSFKISAQLTPQLFNLFMDVKSRLQFDKEIDFYITNAPEMNAYAIASIEQDQAHIININSAVIDSMDEEELRFIIGHEIGHLISNNARISKIIRFVFPEYSKMPLILKHKVGLWEKLSELTADRYGFIACPDFEKCISAFFKLSSGLDIEKIHLDIKKYIEVNERIIEDFKHNKLINITTHPINPIRIKAIELFSKSSLYKGIDEESIIVQDKKLDESVGNLTDLLLIISNSDLDYHRKYFIASAGIIMAGLDKDVNKDEYERIVGTLSQYTVFPKRFLNSLLESENIEQVFHQSASEIMKINPGERYSMLDFLIDIALADKKIEIQEIDFVYEMGEKGLGFSRKEIAQMIANLINRDFMPGLFS